MPRRERINEQLPSISLSNELPITYRSKKQIENVSRVEISIARKERNHAVA